jgi:hypothetical protein
MSPPNCHIAPLARIVGFIQEQGALAGMQLPQGEHRLYVQAVYREVRQGCIGGTEGYLGVHLNECVVAESVIEHPEGAIRGSSWMTGKPEVKSQLLKSQVLTPGHFAH